MNSPSWHRWLSTLRERRARKTRATAHPFFVKLRIETLEDRCLLAAPALVVSTTADSGPGSLRDQILAVNSGSGSVIDFNIPTTDLGYQSSTGTWLIQPATALPDITRPVMVDGTSQPGYAGKPLIELDGQNAGLVANGLEISGGASTVEGLAINRFGANGIQLDTTGGDTIQQNYLGTNITGTTAVGNRNGVFILSASNTVGGTAAGAGNLISGNGTYGIEVDFSSANLIEGNFIGTDLPGTGAVPNALGGILLNAASSNTIGGTAAGAAAVLAPGVGSMAGAANPSPGNLISGNGLTGAGGSTAANGIDIVGTLSVNPGTNLVEGNFIGTDLLGTTRLANTGSGVLINAASYNTIGGSALGAGNLISGNLRDGVQITGISAVPTAVVQPYLIILNPPGQATGNLVEGDFIGTDVHGTTRLANTLDGVAIFSTAASNTVGGTATGAGNLISANNANGVQIAALDPGNVVEGNFIGTDAQGTARLGNVGDGVFLNNSNNNTVGGSAAGAGNLISGNNGSGVQITFGTANLVAGNFIGTDLHGTAPLGNTNCGVYVLNGLGNTIGGATTGATAVLAAGVGSLSSQPSANAGNLLSGNTGDGIFLSLANTNLVEGNFVGTDVNGTANLGNGGTGVFITGAGNTVGGNTSGTGNLISANDSLGVVLTGSGATANLVEGDFIGTDVHGTANLGNIGQGVLITSGVGNIVGGVSAGAGDLISGNTTSGVLINGVGATANVIEGNFIGTDVHGTGRLANGGFGIQVGALGNILGGPTGGAPSVLAPGVGSLSGQPSAYAGNLISANTRAGIFLVMANSNVVQGNFLGTDVNGTANLGNGGTGVYVRGAGNTVGGVSAGTGNLISANAAAGVVIKGAEATANVVEGNFIGTDVHGTANLGNTWQGVLITGSASNNQIGDTVANAALNSTTSAAANTIRFNTKAGVYVASGSGNSILSNSIDNNGFLGIDLAPTGVASHSGANHGQNFPVLTSAVTALGTTTIQGTLTSTLSTTFVIQFFSSPAEDSSSFGQGQVLLGMATVTTGINGQAQFSFSPASPIPVGTVLSATATNAVTGDTSEFAQDILVTAM